MDGGIYGGSGAGARLRILPGLLIGAAFLAMGCLAPSEDAGSGQAGSAGADASESPKTGYLNGQFVRYTVDAGRAVIGGDILVDLAEISDLPPSAAKASSTGITHIDGKYLWPGATIPYSIDRALPNPSRVTDAIAKWTANTNIRFVPYSSGMGNFLFFTTHASACQTPAGYHPQPSQYQTVELADWCDDRSVTHEIGHAIGLMHEHTRSDRDKWIKVNTANITTSCRPLYDLLSYPYMGFGPVDKYSIMIYPSYNTCGIDPSQPTMTYFDGSIIPDNRVPSIYDYGGVKLMYPKYEYPNSNVAKDIGVGNTGAAYIVTNSPASNGNFLLKKFNPAVSGYWQTFPGYGARVDVDMNGYPWLVMGDGTVQRWTGTAYTRVGLLTGVKDIGIGASRSMPYGGVFALSSKVMMQDGNYSIYSWDGSTWNRMTEGYGVKISVDPAGRPWVVNSYTQVRAWDGSQWNQMVDGFGVTDLGISPDGMVYITNGKALSRKVGASNANSTLIEKTFFSMSLPHSSQTAYKPVLAVDGANGGLFFAISAQGASAPGNTQGDVLRGNSN